MPLSPSRSSHATIEGSPFFHPSTPRVVTSTPRGTRRRTVKQPVQETKSSVVGATANLINAIVGSGIVGIPFAIKEAGLVAGFGLVIICAILTEKSLRLLVQTAKHSNTPSYETLCEAAFGKIGFYFVSINMFIMAYGAMVSYLMIVKDTLPYVIGLNDIGLRRAFLFLLSLTVIVPLSSQRDMADLAKTSRLSVTLDTLMVILVVWTAPIQSTLQQEGGLWNMIIQTKQNQHSTIIKPNTVFVGLGVLSFAFVCQHSAFIIAGSLQKPTNKRWAKVSFRALLICAGLASLCGISGYLGYLEETQGNILNNLHDPTNPLPGTLARAFLGVTMMFVYPMESFVARHVCVVLLFAGRRAHEGEDAAVLNRKDRRITLTVALYVLALLPAIVFTNLGNVLSVTGAIGGSCLSYIGPGAVYLGIHGREFVEMVQQYWFIDEERTTNSNNDNNTNSTNGIIYAEIPVTTERRPLMMGSITTTNASGESSLPPPPPPPPRDHWMVRVYKSIVWYLWLMPLWYALARWGAEGTKTHQEEMSLKSPHISRIVGKHQQPPSQQQQRRIMYDDHVIYSGTAAAATTTTESIIGRGLSASTLAPPSVTASPMFSTSYQQQQQQRQYPALVTATPPLSKGPRIIHLQQQQQNGNEEEEEEEDAVVPTATDFVIAIGYMIFGVIALCAGLVSIYVSS